MLQFQFYTHSEIFQYVSTILKELLSINDFITIFFLARQPPVGQGLLIHVVSRSHTATYHSR